MTSVNAEDYADELRKAHWLSEWAKVARPWLAGDHDAYQENLHRFYGGEMVCAGMIYAPAVGLRYPGDPMAAYEVAYRMDIYDIGYARDMTGLMAAMVAEACRPGASPDSILAVIRSVDPKGYFPARLVGRTAHKLLQTARWITKEAREVEVEAFLNDGKPPVKLALPLDTPEQRRRYAIWARAYQLLDAELRRMPFHPDEIWLVTLTGMLIGDFEMAQALPFIVNFGRDNDTSAAMAGAILGALAGASQLPQDWAKAVLRTSSSLDLDFPAMADELLGSILSSR